MPRRWFRRSAGWYITTPYGDMGPFRTEQAARDYPNTWRGWIDAPLFRRGYAVERREA